MTRNDLFYKILFAIEIALLPMVIFAYMFIADWAVGLFISAILICKIWREIFKMRENKTHNIIGYIASVLVFTTLLVFFMSVDVINIALGVIAIVVIVLMQLFSIITYNKKINETVRAIDSCYMIFECLTLVSMIFIMFYVLTTNIGLFAIILTAVASVGYKVYYVFKYMGLKDKLVGLFSKKK